VLVDGKDPRGAPLVLVGELEAAVVNDVGRRRLVANDEVIIEVAKGEDITVSVKAEGIRTWLIVVFWVPGVLDVGGLTGPEGVACGETGMITITGRRDGACATAARGARRSGTSRGARTGMSTDFWIATGPESYETRQLGDSRRRLLVQDIEEYYEIRATCYFVMKYFYHFGVWELRREQLVRMVWRKYLTVDT
jgi:hypothetical protein